MEPPRPTSELSPVLALQAPTTKLPIAVIPRPNQIVARPGAFRLTGDTVIVADASARAEAETLATALRPATGYALPVRDSGQKDTIIMRLDARRSDLGDEGYTLSSSTAGVVITAATSAGLFYGGQTLRQLLPPAVNGTKRVSRSEWLAPAVDISDEPRFAFRGALIDPARNFITIGQMKSYIDALAFHKINHLHIHLTDDQGWRLAIQPTDDELNAANARLAERLHLSAAELDKVKLTRREFDNLTTIGSMRKETAYGRDGTLYDGTMRFDHTPHGGFYTPEQIADLVAYARSRHVEIVPEIEMPGHTGAAIASNPSLGDHPDRQLEVSTHWGVHEAIMRPTERNIAFMQVVLTKVMQMFPSSQYIHIGGDESPKKEWKDTGAVQAKIDELRRAGRLDEALAEGPLTTEDELQAYLERQMATFIAANGRKAAAWDDVLDANVKLPTDKVAIWLWRDIQRGIDAAKAGHPVIMAPTDRAYFDNPPTDSPEEPIGQWGYRTIEQAYDFDHAPDPVPADLPAAAARNIQGTISAIWGEHTYDYDTLQYFTFTRLPALAEASWTARSITTAPNAYADFARRMPYEQQRYDAMGIRYQRPEHPRTRVRDLPKG